MNDTTISLQGWLGSDVTLRRAGETPVARFRVACTPRHFQRRSQEWASAQTQWYTVNAWRQLAENCGRSLRRGDPVVVHGRLVAKSWTNQDGEEVTSLEVEATVIGHDLTWGTSQFSRPPRPEDGSAPGEGAGDESTAAPEGDSAAPAA